MTIYLTSEVLIAISAVEEVGIVAVSTPSPPGFGMSTSVLYVEMSNVEKSESFPAVTKTVYSLAL